MAQRLSKRPTATVSKTQIDRLGNRLKNASPNEKDIRSLNEYRRSFADACDFVITNIHQHLQFAPTGRPAKSLPSIVQKLRRESIRLSQIQDIAGCRIVVTDVSEQDAVVKSLCSLFPDTNIMDRRQISSHGYRAVHLITRISEKLVEIQVRTQLQHLWAELSERCSDVYDPGLKYGLGDQQLLEFLTTMSDCVRRLEEIDRNTPWLEEQIRKLQTSQPATSALPKHPNAPKVKPGAFADSTVGIKESFTSILAKLIAWVETRKGQN